MNARYRLRRIANRLMVPASSSGSNQEADTNSSDGNSMAGSGQASHGVWGQRPIFNGDESKFEIWDVKFNSYLRIRELHSVLTDPAPDAAKNAMIYAELVQVLDDRSLLLVMRDAADDGKRALEILRNHYLGASKPRVVLLYRELATLRKGVEEQVTDYVIRAETTAAALKKAGETVSDSLIQAMLIGGLPQEFDTFCTIVTQRESPMSLKEFKVSLRNFEESKKFNDGQGQGGGDDNVMKVKDTHTSSHKKKCFKCAKKLYGSPG